MKEGLVALASQITAKYLKWFNFELDLESYQFALKL